MSFPLGNHTILCLVCACVLGFNASKNAEKMYEAFGPNSPYDHSHASSSYVRGVMTGAYPVKGKWRGFLVRRFVECRHGRGKTVEESVEVDTNVDPDNIIRNIPLVALLAGRPDMLDILEQSVLQLQVADVMIAVVMAVSRILERYILDASSDESVSEHPIERVCQDLRDPGRRCGDSLDLAMASHFTEVLNSRSLSVEEASAKFGIR